VEWPISSRPRFTFLAAAALALLAAGCASKAPRLASGEVAAGGAPLAPEHTLSPGDQFEIRFPFSPEFNDRVTVGEDGTVAPKLIGSVIVGGLSAPEATARLKALYTKTLKDAELSLTLRLYAPEVFWVDGAVVHPGILRSDLPLTLERAIAQAGGVKPGAATGDILVIRRDETGTVRAYEAELAPPTGATDPILKSFDVVYVPLNPIGSVNEFLATYSKSLPFAATVQTPTPTTTLPPQRITH
jgi:protein involved in polysaccharide export with SLBB domain